MANLRFARRIHDWNRQRKWLLFQERCISGENQTILDVGFAAAAGPDGYQNTLEHSIENLSRVTGLSLDPVPEISPFPGMTMIQYGGGVFPFSDGEFELCWSNAVLEHVGTDTQMIEFLREIARVGRHSFVTTPNRWFPVEPHTKLPLVHFLPKSVFDKILRKTGKSWAAGSYMDLLGEKRLRQLLEDADIRDYEMFKNRVGPFTMDFVVIF